MPFHSKKGFIPNFLSSHRETLIYLFLIMATLITFHQVRNFEFIDYDDQEYVVNNHHIHNGLTLNGVIWAFSSVHSGNWHPLTWLTHAADIHLFGFNAGWHHLVSLLFHILNSLLLFHLFKKMTGDVWQSGFVAALFAIHPLHVESVVWVSERKDVLCTFFWIFGVINYVRYVEKPVGRRYIAVLLSLMLGLLSKPMIVTFPFVLLLLDYWPLKRTSFAQRRFAIKIRNVSKMLWLNHSVNSRWLYLIYEKTPLFGLVAASSLATFVIQGKSGAVVSMEVLSLSERIVTALNAYISYIRKMFWPNDLAVFYPHAISVPYWKTTIAILVFAFLTVIFIKLRKQHSYLIIGWFWYLGTLVPVIGLVQVGSQAMADRYTYFPLIGLFIIVAWGAPNLLKKWKYKRQVLASLIAVILILLINAARIQTQYWKSSLTLFRHTLQVTQHNALAHYLTGYALVQNGNANEALRHFKAALAIDPLFEKAYNQMGLLFASKGELDQAVLNYKKALSVNPNYKEAYINLGKALQEQGKLNEAMNQYQTVLEIDPDYKEAHVNIANIYSHRGNHEQALSHYNRALRIEPNFVQAHYNLGNMWLKLGKFDQAIRCYLAVLRINPSFEKAHNNLGLALIYKGNINAAIIHFQEALKIKPDFRQAHHNLQQALKDKKNK